MTLETCYRKQTQDNQGRDILRNFDPCEWAEGEGKRV